MSDSNAANGSGRAEGDTEGRVPGRDRRRFPDISSRAYEHPADRSALVALRKLSGFDTVFKALSGLLPERSLRLLFLSDSVRVSDQQFPHLHTMLLDACYILDLPKVPPMYVTQDPQPNAMCVGLDEPVIVVTTGLVELLDEEEMRAVVGHEVGHALSGHSVYRTILLFLTNFALKVAWIPLGGIAITAIVTALREWFRKSELSADRAGLLVGQDLRASLRGLMKLAGGNHLHEMNVDAFLAQAAEYEAGGDLRDSVLKIMNVLPRSHPFATVRAAELKRWAESRDFQRLMDGHYPRRAEDKDASITDSFRESANHYAESVRSSKDPLMGLVRDIAGGANDLGSRLRDTFTGRSGGGPKDTPRDPADAPRDEPRDEPRDGGGKG
ncbi:MULTISPECIES: M48 family metallopeptidase [Streptomyces]|uniref:M48 family metallopeptidase n=1 Tax=Streptomyces TaxID=1883 RepID=UPI00163BBF40|nr:MULTISPECIES: M48 family metallopeptidase [Streptomyces]MBC2878940.1 M48 family metallopeptidase [Streptomyces sp. TYQ1024]UBI38877.1 M48 family metallopeptidase [Streptomyces mobaraensis]UKW31457.1 M48 family metallopeptidase [Streptomyces sp. TYQ1024]